MAMHVSKTSQGSGKWFDSEPTSFHGSKNPHRFNGLISHSPGTTNSNSNKAQARSAAETYAPTYVYTSTYMTLHGYRIAPDKSIARQR